MDSFRYILYAYKRTLLRANDDGKRMETRHRSIRRREISFSELPPLRISVWSQYTTVHQARIVFAVGGTEDHETVLSVALVGLTVAERRNVPFSLTVGDDGEFQDIGPTVIHVIHPQAGQFHADQ